MKTILCDMDGVVADLLAHWLAVYNYEFRRNVRVSDITDWDTGKCVPDGAAVYPIIERPGFFGELPVMPGAVEGLEALLARGHDVFLVSAGAGWALSDKSHWVAKHMPFMRNRMLLTNGKTPKGLVRGDVLIDDGPHNLIDFKKRNPAACAIACAYPYTTPGLAVADFVVPFIDDSAGGWKAIVGILSEGR
jgi:5'-nucleotidase